MSEFIDPEMAPILATMRAAPPLDYAAMPIAEARALFDATAAPWRALAPAFPRIEDIALPGPAGPIRARLYRAPTEGAPVVIFAHGGGWTFGSVDTHENEMRHLALASSCAVLGFDYRLGPEHVFPAALEDTLAVVTAVRGGALGAAVDPARLALAGDSAGANLALGAALALRARGEPAQAAALFYGCYAPQFDTESHRAYGAGDFGLSTQRMRWYWKNFLGAAVQAPPPFAAPLLADLSGAPPLHLLAAGLDPLRDETYALARALAAAETPHEVFTTPGVIHGFLGRAPRLSAARRALETAAAFLTSRLASA